MAGSTTVLGGTVRASALPGYSGGSIVVSGASVGVLESNISLPSDFGFSTPLASVRPDLIGTLDVAASALSGEGFMTVGVGYTDPADPAGSITASTLTVKAGTVLQAENIILAAAIRFPPVIRSPSRRAESFALASPPGTQGRRP